MQKNKNILFKFLQIKIIKKKEFFKKIILKQFRNNKFLNKWFLAFFRIKIYFLTKKIMTS
jgi:hypothetical protein